MLMMMSDLELILNNKKLAVQTHGNELEKSSISFNIQKGVARAGVNPL
jgi:hypothetical protein